VKDGYHEIDNSDGSRYEGEFRNNLFHGKGVLIAPSLGTRFEGEFRNGKKHYGIFTCEIGGYKGQHKDGLPDGQGESWGNNGHSYKGEFKESQPHGHGMVTFPDGTQWKGVFENGAGQGLGIYTSTERVKSEEKYPEKKDTFWEQEKLRWLTEGYTKGELTEALGEVLNEEKSDTELHHLLYQDESEKLEFKASLWTGIDKKTDKPIKNQTKKSLKLQDAVVKTIAGFCNVSGGTLLIGVKDKPKSLGKKSFQAKVIGIQYDYQYCQQGKQDPEGFERSLRQILENAYSHNAVHQTHVKISFPKYEELTLCRVDVKPLPRNGINNALYTNTETMGMDRFFTRSGDSTILNSMATAVEYINHHFNHIRDRENLAEEDE